MSHCRSFGSNYHPSSQSRKISIGIMVDQPTKTRLDNVRAEAAAVPVTGTLGSSKVNSTEDMRKIEKAKDHSNDKQTKAADHETSPWVSTRSFHQNVPSFEELCNTKQASSMMLNQRQNFNGANDSERHSVQFISNQKSVLQSDDGLKKLNRVTYRRRGQKDDNSDRVNEVPFVTAQDLKVPAKEGAQQKTDNTENKGNETLRLKLWEVLGNVSTPTKQSSSSQAIKTGTDLEPEGKSDKKESPAVKPKQNSDTIESDSDSPNRTMKRPVTRSLTRKRLPKAQQHKTKKAPPSSDKHKHQEKTIFSFDDGWSRRITSATKGGSSVLKREKKENARIEPRKLHFPKCNNEDETQQPADNGKKKSPFESSSLFESGMGRSCSFSLKENKDSLSFTVMEKTDRLGNHNEPILPQNAAEQDAKNPSLKSILEPQFQFQTPKLGLKLPTSFLESSTKRNQGKKDVQSPMRGVLNMENIRSFKSFLASELDSDKKNKEADTSGDEAEGKDYPVKSSLPDLKENHMAKSPSTSSEDNDSENDSESSDQGSPTEVPSEAETPSPEIITAQEPEILLHPTKRCRINNRADAAVFSPLSTSPKVSGEFHGFPSELNQENGLARAVSLFAMVLERVKSKMKTVTNKRSTEILSSVAADIHLQLQNAESQIQKDVGKLTGIGKTKRKRLETRFQEQQEQLKDMYGRFRNEVNLHLQDCRSTLEGLESQQTEFKEVVEEQKASHGKVLLQAEEAIKTQLNDAERRITTVHKSAREKMLQLKYVIAECLEEDVLC